MEREPRNSDNEVGKYCPENKMTCCNREEIESTQ